MYNIIAKIINNESFPGMLLCAVAALAFFIANTPLQSYYHSFFYHNILTIGHLNLTPHFIINDILMGLLFLQVGIEIRHEVEHGTLSKLKHALLPLNAALGGVMMPALIYLSFNHCAETIHGWAIPTATDIAFASGIFSLLAGSFPKSLGIILVSIAVIDDIIAILIIAVFYNQEITYGGLIVGFLSFIASYFYIKKYGANLLFIAVNFIVIWLALYNSGIHPTLSGVLIGILIPPILPNQQPKQYKYKNLLGNIVNFLIMPLFTLANAAITLNSINLDNLCNIKLALGVFLGLIIGKPVGIFSACWISTKLKLCELPMHVDMKQVFFISLLAGIGFTMALFVILLSFTESSKIELAKTCITVGSITSAVIGIIYGKYISRKYNYAK